MAEAKAEAGAVAREARKAAREELRSRTRNLRAKRDALLAPVR